MPMPTRLIGCERWYSPARLFAEVRQLLFTALTLACLVPLTIVHAQEAPSDASFSSLRIAVSSGTLLQQSGMPGWSPGSDLRLSVDTRYGRGWIRLDVSYRAWQGADDVPDVIDQSGNPATVDLPDAQTTDILAGVGFSSAPRAPVSVHAGLLLGNRFMLFDLPSTAPGRLESEMIVGPWLRLGGAIGRLGMFTEVRVLRVLTRPRWDSVGLSAGLSWTIQTPGWIRWILQ